MGRPPTKSTKALIKAKLTAEAKFYKSNIGREVWLRTQVERLIDKIDPLELAAAIGGTIIVYDIIKGTEELIVAVSYWKGFPGSIKWFETIINKTELDEESKKLIQSIKDTPDFNLYIKSFVISYMMVKHSGQIISGVGNVTSFISGMFGLKAI